MQPSYRRVAGHERTFEAIGQGQRLDEAIQRIRAKPEVAADLA